MIEENIPKGRQREEEEKTVEKKRKTLIIITSHENKMSSFFKRKSLKVGFTTRDRGYYCLPADGFSKSRSL